MTSFWRFECLENHELVYKSSFDVILGIFVIQ